MVGLFVGFTAVTFWLVGTVWIVATDRLFGGEQWHLSIGWAFVFGILFGLVTVALCLVVRELRSAEAGP